MFLNPLTKPHSSTMRNSKDEQFFSLFQQTMQVTTTIFEDDKNFWREQRKESTSKRFLRKI